YVLMLGYAIALALIALLLEMAARHAHKRSLETATVGFTYHRERDIWKCPQDQQLFPVFSDHAKGIVVYRAPASACNSCPSKAACTDSDTGREIERRIPQGLEYGMQRFHRAMSITLLALADLILVVELFRTAGLYPRLALVALLLVFSLIIRELAASLRPGRAKAKKMLEGRGFDRPSGFRVSFRPWRGGR
ncbi:MAG: hypothetical protein ACRD3F_17250, partial [Acidobacteriaceae bacterium]